MSFGIGVACRPQLAARTTQAFARVPRQARGVSDGSAGGIRLTLGDGAYPLSVDGRPALFLEESQELHSLNAAAGALIARLIAGIDLEDFLQFSLPHAAPGPSESQPGSMERLLIAWSALGIVDAEATDPCGSWLPPALLAAGHAVFRLDFPASDFGRLLAAPYEHLPSAGQSTRRVAVAARNSLAFIMVDDAIVRIVGKEQAASQLHHVLLQQVLKSDRLIALHAACAEVDGRAVLFCGAPGAGKSTMAHAVAAHANQLCADDVVIFDPATELVMGVPFPLTRKLGKGQPCTVETGGGEDILPELRADGAWVQYLALPNHAAAKWLRIGHVIDLARADCAAASLAPLSRIDALKMLFGEAHAVGGRSDAFTVSSLSSAVASVEAWRLHYREADDARALLVSRLG